MLANSQGYGVSMHHLLTHHTLTLAWILAKKARLVGYKVSNRNSHLRYLAPTVLCILWLSLCSKGLGLLVGCGQGTISAVDQVLTGTLMLFQARPASGDTPCNA